MLNILVYTAVFYVNICGSYKLTKNSPVFGPPCIRKQTRSNPNIYHFIGSFRSVGILYESECWTLREQDEQWKWDG